MAYDDLGRKFTNCTSVIANIDISTKYISYIPLVRKYDEIKNFLKSQIELVKLQNRFALNNYAVEMKDLAENTKFDEDFQFHNNFGVCQVMNFKAGDAKALFSGKASWDYVVSPQLHISIFTNPYNLGPDYELIFDDLYENKDRSSENSVY